MPEPLIIVQNNYITRNTGAVAIYARKRRIEMLDISFTDDMDFDASGVDFSARPTIVLFGSVGFLKKALQHKDIRNHLSWTEYAFRASLWKNELADAYLGASGHVMRASEVAAELSGGGTFAVRPEYGMKEFVGGVYDEASWKMLKVESSEMCFTATPSEILSEHRIWFVDGKPVFGVRYRANGDMQKDLHQADEAMEASAKIAETYLPLPNVVMDVALTPDGWRVIEFNCIHTSGWYDFDPTTVLDAQIASVHEALPPYAR